MVSRESFPAQGLHRFDGFKPNYPYVLQKGRLLLLEYRG